MKMRHSVAAVAAASAMLLAACGGSSDDTAGGSVDSLKFYNDKAAWKPQFEEVSKVSQDEIGLALEPVGYSEANQYAAFIRSSFRTKEKPDLFTWHTGKELEDLVRQGLVAETTSLWDKAIADGDVPEDLREYFTVDGKQYCVPLQAGYWVMFYNKRIFDQEGITPPSTWAQLEATAERLKGAGVTPFHQTNVLFTFSWFQTLLTGSDPELYEALSTGEAKYTDPGVVSVMDKWRAMLDKGYFSDPGSKTDPQVMLKNGDVAMINMGTWFNGNLKSVGMEIDKDYGMFVIPNVDPSLATRPMVVEAGPVCTAADATHREEAERYSAWWFTPPAQTAWANARGELSFNPRAEVSDETLAGLSDEINKGDYRLMNRYFEAAPVPVLTAALDGFGAFVTKPGDPMPVLKEVQAAADAYWAEQG